MGIGQCQMHGVCPLSDSYSVLDTGQLITSNDQLPNHTCQMLEVAL